MSNNSNEQLPMVEWYSPSQLRDTAIKTAISTIIGENADPRLIAAAGAANPPFDYTKELVSGSPDYDFKPTDEPRNEIWIDYVSDVGDGWNPTYSIAYSLARRGIDVAGQTTRRGEILVFGGDGVYPTATSEDYEKRLLKPYRTAFETVGKPIAGTAATNLENAPHVFALPGNHDWYDSLVSFQKLFFTHIFNNRTFAGGWRTRQKRSYFALRLPHKWWLLGVDLQLSHNIDIPQLEYFETVVKQMQPGDKVILCVPEPYWVKAIKYEGLTDKFEKKEASIETLEQTFARRGVEVRLYLAGDLHHYRRFATEDGQYQKITAGGGGAFLHPTHDFNFADKIIRSKTPDPHRFFWQKNYPDYADSRSMDWGNLYGFVFKNKTFGFLTGALYALLAFLTHGDIEGNFTLGKAFQASVVRCVEQPLALIVVVLMLLGLVFFTDSNSTYYRRIAGTIHGLLHLTAIFFLGWLGFLLMRYIIAAGNLTNPATKSFVWLLCILVVCFAGGFVIGSAIMGLYLFVSIHFFKRHDNEAFSAMKIEDYKNFLRLHIDSNGNLTIYPFKIERAVTNWDFGSDGETCEPGHDLYPDLIEDPIVLK